MDGDVLRGPGPREQPQVARVRHSQALVEHLPGEGEDGGVGADSERQRTGGDGGEAGALPQHARAVAEIVADLVPPAQAEGSTHLFLLKQGRAQRDARAPGGFGRRQSRADEFGGHASKMMRKLGVHV